MQNVSERVFLFVTSLDKRLLKSVTVYSAPNLTGQIARKLSTQQ